MNARSQDDLRSSTKRYIILLRIKNGYRDLMSSFVINVFFKGFIALYCTILILLLISESFTNNHLAMIRLNQAAILSVSIVLLFFSVFALLYFSGTPKGAWRIDREMARISVKNGIGEAPFLVDIREVPESDLMEAEFFGYGIPRDFYEDNIPEIEAALNAIVAEIRDGRDKRHTTLVLADPHAIDVPERWEDHLISHQDFILNIGKSALGYERIDLNLIPHMLIGGSTGSGKTVLLKNLLYQCYCKGARVYVADFKGGIDFGCTWEQLVHVDTTIDALINTLDNIVSELNDRKIIFREQGYVNFANYSNDHPIELRRIIFACDEIAELLDKSGLDKTEKEQIASVEKSLSTIARQGRAFGIHLILATQRPDATILNGQIRNNLDYRICGRADDVLSKIVLDKTDASERIPKYERGLFLTNFDHLVRAFYFTDDDLTAQLEELSYAKEFNQT